MERGAGHRAIVLNFRVIPFILINFKLFCPWGLSRGSADLPKDEASGVPEGCAARFFLAGRGVCNSFHMMGREPVFLPVELT